MICTEVMSEANKKIDISHSCALNKLYFKYSVNVFFVGGGWGAPQGGYGTVCK